MRKLFEKSILQNESKERLGIELIDVQDGDILRFNIPAGSELAITTFPNTILSTLT